MLFNKILKSVVEEARKTVVPTVYAPVAWILMNSHSLNFAFLMEKQDSVNCEVMVPEKG